ncbi:MAG: matrixin family metalloprotease [bacterium]
MLAAYSISSNQWSDKSLITYSIPSDGVFWYSGVNQMNSVLSSQLGSDWQKVVAEVFDKWTRSADIDIAQVPDKGGDGDYQAASQGASQFGDIRIGGFSFNENPLRVLAMTSSPPPDGWTRAGDVQINLDNNWTDGGAYDFRTVLLHELGHSLGLDHVSDTGSIMFDRYAGVRRDLQTCDIEGIQAIYGHRREDSFTRSGQGTSNFNPIQMQPPALGQRTSQTGKMELASSGATDYFQVAIPSGFTGTSLIVKASATGVSMLSPALIQVDSSGNVIQRISSPGQWGGSGSINLGLVQPGQSFYFRVEAAEMGRFDIGGYNFSLNYIGGQVPSVPPPVVTPPPTVPAIPPVVPPKPPVVQPPVIPTPPVSIPTPTPVVTRPQPVPRGLGNILRNLGLGRRAKPQPRRSANQARVS